MDMKSMQTAVDGLSSAIDAKFAKYDQQMAEMKNAFSVAPQAKQVDDVEMKDFCDFVVTGRKASQTNTQYNAQEIAIPKYTKIQDKMRADNQILSIINTVNVAGNTGAAIPVDTTEPVVSVVGEGAKVTETAPAIDLKTINLQKYMAKVGLTLEMAQATAVDDMYQYIVRKTADALGRKIADDVTTTITGSADLATVTSSTASAVKVEDLMDMMGAVVDKANNNGKFIMNSKTYYALAKAVGTSANWFTMPYSEGIKPSMFGHEVIFDSKVDDVASGKTAILYGDFSHAVTAVQANGVTATRDDITGMDQGIVYLRTYQLFNSGLVRPESIVGLKIKA